MQYNPILSQVESVCFMGALAVYFAAAALYFVALVVKKEKAGRGAFLLSAVGFALHTVSIAARGINAGRLPFTNQYEFATCFAWGITLCFLLFAGKFHFQALGTFVVPLVFLVLGYASMQSREIHALMPALQSRWLGFHVSMAIISYGSFGVAFAVAMVLVFGNRLKAGGLTDRHLPDEDTLDLIIYRAVALGFLFLSLCIVTGAIWAQKAWGSYWSWDPKETWSLITWIIYAIFLHLRLNRGWRGRKAAVFAIVGFLCVIFTYVGVNTLLAGLHSYA